MKKILQTLFLFLLCLLISIQSFTQDTEKQILEVQVSKEVIDLVSKWDPSINFFMPVDNSFTTLEGIKREEYACWGIELFDELNSLIQLLQLPGEGVNLIGDGSYNSPIEIKPKVYVTWNNYEGSLTGAKRFILVEKK
jgi:hypothetical protein